MKKLICLAVLGLALAGCKDDSSPKSPDLRTVKLYSGGNVIGQWTFDDSKSNTYSHGLYFTDTSGKKVYVSGTYVVEPYSEPSK